MKEASPKPPCSFEDIDAWFRHLADSHSPEGRQLFASELFLRTLDGEYADAYLEDSLQAAKGMAK